MKRKLLVLLLVVVVLAAAVPVFASGGVWHMHGHVGGGHGGHVCAMTCVQGHLDPIRCQCVGVPPRFGGGMGGRLHR